LSWIVQDLWQTLEKHRKEYERFLNEAKLEGFWAINRIAARVGDKWGVFIQVNFPPGRSIRNLEKLGHQDLSILVHRERRSFQGITEEELKEAFRALNPVSYDSTGFGYEGFRVKLASGRIDILPGGIHIWCEITPEVCKFLDWLFIQAYGLQTSQPEPVQKMKDST